MKHSKILMMTTLEEEVRCIIAGQLLLDTEYIHSEKTLLEAGFDSLGLFDLADSIMEQFRVMGSNRMVPGTLTIGGLINLIDANYRQNDKKEKSS